MAMAPSTSSMYDADIVATASDSSHDAGDVVATAQPLPSPQHHTKSASTTATFETKGAESFNASPPAVGGQPTSQATSVVQVETLESTEAEPIDSASPPGQDVQEHIDHAHAQTVAEGAPAPVTTRCL